MLDLFDVVVTTSRLDPFADFRINVSSASTMPVTTEGRLSGDACRKRWRRGTRSPVANLYGCGRKIEDGSPRLAEVGC